jgi:hypothetical protein
MRRALPALFAFAVAPALLAATPSPRPASASLTVVCSRAPLYLFAKGSNMPVRAHTFPVTMGERFRLVNGPRTTLESTQYYETDIPVAEPGWPPGTHYWISSACAVPG